MVLQLLDLILQFLDLALQRFGFLFVHELGLDTVRRRLLSASRARLLGPLLVEEVVGDDSLVDQIQESPVRDQIRLLLRFLTFQHLLQFRQTFYLLLAFGDSLFPFQESFVGNAVGRQHLFIRFVLLESVSEIFCFFPELFYLQNANFL